MSIELMARRASSRVLPMILCALTGWFFHRMKKSFILSIPVQRMSRMVHAIFASLMSMSWVPPPPPRAETSAGAGPDFDAMAANLGAAIPQMQAGRLRALAVTGAARWPLLPDTPTMQESGLPNYEWTFWNAAWLPANTPPEIVNRMNEWISAALERPRVKDYLLNSGSTAFGTTPDGLMKFQIAEHDKWRKVIAAARIQAE